MRTPINRIVPLALALTVAGALAADAHSGKNLPKPFAQRHAVMTSLAAHLGAIRTAVRTDDRKGIARHAVAIHWLARILPDTFPNGSGAAMGKTRAAERIWTDWSGFLKASQSLATEATAMADKAKSATPAELRQAFMQLGRIGCGECHKTYRLPKR